MASLRPSVLLRKAGACSRPWLQLERPQLGLVRIGASHTVSAASAASIGRQSRIPAEARHSSTSQIDGDGSLEDALAMDEVLERFAKAGIEGVDGSSIFSGGEGGEGRGITAATDQLPQPERLAAYARPLPVSPSYFSQQPQFDDHFLHLQELFRRFGHLPLVPSDQIEVVAWKSLREYRNMTGEDIKAPQYNRCIALVKHLNRIHPSLKPPSVEGIVDEFLRDINPFKNVPKPLTIDRFGRAVGVGRRKTSVARAWVVEGTGEVRVNGKSLSDAFGRVHDRESATWALRATDRADKYNVWALVGGGGTTGQAEALTLAVAKGLVAHEPALKTALRQGKLFLDSLLLFTYCGEFSLLPVLLGICC